jgi:large subunit ribosomal protein L35
MPKMKTHRGAAKRFKKTGTGKVVRAHAGRRHILTKKNRKRKRHLRRDAIVEGADSLRVRLMLPND